MTTPLYTATGLVEAYTQVDQEWAYHTQVCPDQREIYGCATCEDINRRRYAAQRAMEANDGAVALYNSDEQRELRRRWTREVFNPLHEAATRYDEGW